VAFGFMKNNGLAAIGALSVKFFGFRIARFALPYFTAEKSSCALIPLPRGKNGQSVNQFIG
jgi:hypothetical protein